MIRRHLMALRLALMLGDGVATVLVFLLVSLVRFGDGEAQPSSGSDLRIDVRLAAALFGDFKILVRTVPAVVGRTGK